MFRAFYPVLYPVFWLSDVTTLRHTINNENLIYGFLHSTTTPTPTTTNNGSTFLGKFIALDLSCF